MKTIIFFLFFAFWVSSCKSNKLVIKQPAPVVPNTFTNYIETATNPNFKMIAIKGGRFRMGSKVRDCEQPVHRVRVPDFYLAEFEVTQKLWRDVMGSDPEELYYKGKDNNPVEGVSWDDIQKFIKKLNRKTGKTYRLPSEAEWEYAARGGQKSKGYKYAGSNTIGNVAEYHENSTKSTKPVGGKKKNELGLYDMSGNVWEWCEDKYYDDYKKAPKDGSAWVSGSSSFRVIRGGSEINDAAYCRVASRFNYLAANSSIIIGFRLAASLSMVQPSK